MSPDTDALSALITAGMVALIRLIDAWIAVEAGIPISSLEPASLEDLDAEAKTYVDQITADRRQRIDR